MSDILIEVVEYLIEQGTIQDHVDFEKACEYVYDLPEDEQNCLINKVLDSKK